MKPLNIHANQLLHTKVNEAKEQIEKGFNYECEIEGFKLQENKIIQNDPGECKSGPGEI
jgi:hypothetical protein